MGTPILVTLLPSTDVDLGRWLMAHYQLPYAERPHAPVFHILALKWWGMGKDDYPLLVSADRREKTGTIEKLVAKLDAEAPPELRLLPDKAAEPELAKQVDTLQHEARWVTGGAVVNWSYWNFLKHKSVVWPSIATGVPWWEYGFLLVGFRLIRAAMYKGLKLDQAAADRALAEIEAGFDRLDALLADGRDYLAGGRLTFADLAVSASLAPMVLAQGYHGMLPNQARCPVDMQEIYARLRQRPAGLYIQRIYDRHRPLLQG
ncbi:glutathione S-transferase C-terminal domain-containing protein [Poseidonocella sp. HB161398]|uniref:glutathione S-transferase C-terminal domain-containing protein n=1 Tax=Poseidonocella sp. HB161398 TaxID=2320855 RepID=UPI001107F49C|nr:glutathione S-transferase C-terminal domain-containing protein [Poseidonocella sp. HB161398]